MAVSRNSRVRAGQLVTARELCEKTGLSIHKANDYVSRRFLLVEGRGEDGRSRLFRDPPASDIVAAIQDYLGDHGNLNMCDRLLRERFPTYYRQA